MSSKCGIDSSYIANTRWVSFDSQFITMQCFEIIFFNHETCVIVSFFLFVLCLIIFYFVTMRAVWSEHSLVAWLSYECWATGPTPLAVSKLKRTRSSESTLVKMPHCRNHMSRLIYVCLDIKWARAWDFQQFGMWHHQSLISACAYAQSDKSLC